MKRRELFTSLFSKKKEELIVRPPYFNNENSFYKECVNCLDKPCISFCEENVIVINNDKTVKLDFNIGACTYCDECAKACANNVLNIEEKSQINVKVEIDMTKCMSWYETMCFSCKDPCLDDAIEFIGMFRPSINEEKCTSCGFCIKVCPNESIIIRKEI